MSRHQIVFSGQLVPGASLEQVQANLAKLFRADAARIAVLFSGRRVPIKGDLDAADAEKYRITLERAGALVDIVPMEEAAKIAPGQETGPAAEGRTQRRPLVVAPRDVYMAAFVEVEAPDFGVAEVGVDLREPGPEVVPPTLDLSGLSLAPLGSDMGQASAPPAGPAPDTSSLRLEAS